MKLTQKQLAQYIQMCAPEHKQMPAWVDKASSRKSFTGKRNNPEEQLQLQCAEWLRLQPSVLWWSTPNHLLYKKSPSGAELAKFALQKRLGVHKGVSDICVIFRAKNQDLGNVTVCFFELKAGSNKATEEQAQWLSKANALGCRGVVITDVTQMIDALRAAGL